jgi:hypothetical protein
MTVADTTTVAQNVEPFGAGQGGRGTGCRSPQPGEGRPRKVPERGESRRAGAGRPAARHRHQNIDAKKAELAAKSAARSADIAEEDALFAIDYAYATIEEAEYAALDAVLARMDADELAAK